jgi:hypothetical protein
MIFILKTEFERMVCVVGKKSIPAFKINIFWAISVPNSVPTPVQESIFPPKNSFKNSGSDGPIRQVVLYLPARLGIDSWAP